MLGSCSISIVGWSCSSEQRDCHWKYLWETSDDNDAPRSGEQASWRSLAIMEMEGHSDPIPLFSPSLTPLKVPWLLYLRTAGVQCTRTVCGKGELERGPFVLCLPFSCWQAYLYVLGGERRRGALSIEGYRRLGFEG